MREIIKAIFVLIIFLFLGLFLDKAFFQQENVFANQIYLPKADLIKGSGPEVYILENGVKRWIPDPETFEHFRYRWTNIKSVADSVLAAYPQGDKLDKNDDYPEGTLLRGAGPEVYLIESGKRRWFPSPAVFEGNNFGWRYIYEVDEEELEKIPQGDSVSLAETNRYPETFILEGPAEGAILESDQVSFKYSGTNPLGSVSDLSFETYLVGHDDKWHNQRSRYTLSYNLSEESRVYTFYVRAKNKQGYVDPTPASLSFQVGVSSDFQKMEIRSVHAKESDFKKDYFVLRNNSKETINISGWTVKTKAETIVIPKAVKNLRVPFSGSYASDIELGYRDEVLISASLSPNGTNFRTNKCTGYLDQLSQFHPSLDEDCPYLDKSKYSHLKKTCRDFIDDLGRCEIPDYSNDLAVSSDSQCTGFLNEHFAYDPCYDAYYQDPDFFDNKWRVFLGRSADILDNGSDTMILRDRSGLKVDEYEYGY